MHPIIFISILCFINILSARFSNGQPGGRELNNYESVNRNVDLDDVESSIDSKGVALDEEKSNKLKLLNYPTSYTDYDYYLNSRRLPWQVKDLAGASTISLPSANGVKLTNLDYDMPLPASLDGLNKRVKPYAWYGPLLTKSNGMNDEPMYPSRSYDPYIRRYDRYDEQYYRAYPQYYDDIYVHRQRFDPHDSYSPRVPQFPEPYNLYPDRYLDTPHPRDYVKYRGYGDAVPMTDPLANKYRSSSLPELTQRNERIVYYAHLPEIVRTPYEVNQGEDRNIGAGILSPSPYKLNKKKFKINTRPLDNNSTNYKL